MMFGTPNGDTQSDLTTTTTQKAMKTTATMMFGSIEDDKDIVEHFHRIC